MKKFEVRYRPKFGHTVYCGSTNERETGYFDTASEAQKRCDRLNRDLEKAGNDTAAAEKMGVSERHVRRLTQVGLVLGLNEIEQLRDMVKPAALKDLMELAKMDNNSMRSDLVGRLAQGGVKSIAEGKRLFWSENKPNPKDPVEEAFKGLLNAWKRAPKAAQRRFVTASQAEIYPLIVAANLGGAKHECSRSNTHMVDCHRNRRRRGASRRHGGGYPPFR